MDGGVHNHKQLRVWCAARDLAVATYEATSRFPTVERFGLTSQMRRAAVSVAANLAEGAGRGSAAELKRFVRIASGSASEYETHVIVAEQVGLLQPEPARTLTDAIVSVKRMLYRLEKSLDAGSR
jgi:four helix bundle protein